MAATKTSWIPQPKVIAAGLTGLLTIFGQAIATGGWDATESGSLVTLGIALVAAYFKTGGDS